MDFISASFVWFSLTVGICFCTIPAITIWILSFKAQGEKTTGRVIGFEISRSKKGTTMYSPAFEYSYGKYYRFQSSSSSNVIGFSIDEAVELIVNPSDPSQATLANSPAKYLIIKICVAAILIGLGLIIYVFWSHNISTLFSTPGLLALALHILFLSKPIYHALSNFVEVKNKFLTEFNLPLDTKLSDIRYAYTFCQDKFNPSENFVSSQEQLDDIINRDKPHVIAHIFCLLIGVGFSLFTIVYAGGVEDLISTLKQIANGDMFVKNIRIYILSSLAFLFTVLSLHGLLFHSRK